MGIPVLSVKRYSGICAKKKARIVRAALQVIEQFASSTPHRSQWQDARNFRPSILLKRRFILVLVKRLI
jgi:hypothetical protein